MYEDLSLERGTSLCDLSPVATVALFRFLHLFALALWVGGGAFTAFAVAPAVFQHAGARRVAGDVNAAIFRRLDRLILGCLFVLAASEGVEASTGLSTRDALRILFEGAMATMALASMFVVSPRIRALRPHIDPDKPPEEDPSPERARFGRLHGASVMLLLGQLVLGAFALALSLPLDA